MSNDFEIVLSEREQKTFASAGILEKTSLPVGEQANSRSMKKAPKKKILSEILRAATVKFVSFLGNLRFPEH